MRLRSKTSLRVYALFFPTKYKVFHSDVYTAREKCLNTCCFLGFSLITINLVDKKETTKPRMEFNKVKNIKLSHQKAKCLY